MEYDDEILKVPEEMISQAVATLYKSRFINTKEKFACQLYGGKVIMICSIDKVTPLKIESKQTFGMIQSDDETDITVKAANPKSIKIVSNRMTEKQVFKKNMNF